MSKPSCYKIKLNKKILVQAGRQFLSTGRHVEQKYLKSKFLTIKSVTKSHWFILRHNADNRMEPLERTYKVQEILCLFNLIKGVLISATLHLNKIDIFSISLLNICLIYFNLLLLMECEISEDWPSGRLFIYKRKTSNTIFASVSVSFSNPFVCVCIGRVN